MSSNSKIIEKADWAVADLVSTGGRLQPEDSDAFIRKMINQPTLLRAARVYPMSSPQRNINLINFGSRILKPGVSATALSVGDRSKPTTSKVVLTTKEVIAEIRLSYDVIEDNIERGSIGLRANGSMGDATGGIKETIMDLIAERAALDLEELGLLGDTASGDAYLALVDGWLKLATANVVDFGTAPVDKDSFKQMLQGMPTQYLRNLNALRHWMSVSQEIAYRDVLGNRQTALGDSMTQGTAPVFGLGVPVEKAALMPNANVLMTFPQNLVFGIQRDIHIETDKDIKSREYIIVLTARVDFKYEDVDAVVKGINLG